MRKLIVFLALALIAFAGAAQNVYVEPPLEFSDTPVRTALDTIFMKAGNVPYSIEITNPAEVPPVTLKLTERQELEALLKLVLDTRNLEFKKDSGGVYHISKVGGGAKPAAVSKVTKLFALTYATAGEIVRQVKGVLTKDGGISVDVGTNALIISDDPAVFEGVENLLKELDNPERKAKLISIKTRLLEVTNNTDTLMAIDWQYSKAASLSVLGGTLSNPFQLGTRFNVTDPTTGYATKGAGFYIGPITWTAGLDSVLTGLFASANASKVEMTADPDVVVEDGTEARIQIGSKEPILSASATSSGTTITYTYQDVNIVLTVTPQSQRDGTISIQINPVVNQISGYVSSTVQGTTSTVPRIDNREVRTKLFVANGGTIRLGGMLKDRTTTSELKIPILGDIPLIGLLFKKTEPIVDKIDLQMLVSPHIVDYVPPRCKETPWISALEATMSGDMDVKVDWSKDLPFGANNIFSYNVYRDTNPITSLDERKPFASGVSGESTNWVDSTKKRRGGTYYYVVTAINPSGMEQSISSDPKFNAQITIP